MSASNQHSGGTIGVATLNRDELRRRVAEKYRDVATNPELGFHFHTGAPLAACSDTPQDVVAGAPAGTVDSFAGTGNPFLFGDLHPGETVVDVGCGAGFDTLIAAGQVGPHGRVIAVDMTAEMRAKAVAGARHWGTDHVEVLEGLRRIAAGSRTRLPTSSSATASSTSARTSPRSFARCTGCSSRAAASRSATSSSTARCPRTRRMTSSLWSG